MTEELIKGVKSLAHPKVIVIGELMLDRYIWGEVERISPEAPIPVMRISSSEEKLGGAGSVVNNLIALEAEPICLSVVGTDAGAEKIREHLKAAGADHRSLITDPSWQTIIKTRMIGFVQSAHRAAQHILRMDEERKESPSEEVQQQFLSAFDAHISSADVVIISDYNKGFLNRRLLGHIFEMAQRAGVITIVDPGRRSDFSLYRGATIITPNRYEAHLATGCQTNTHSGLTAAGEKLIKELGCRYVCITIDKEGQFLCYEDAPPRHFPVKPRAVYDVTGAGDMVSATLGVALGSGLPIELAVEISDITAGIEVTKLGVATVSRTELLEHLQLHAPVIQGYKIKDWRQIHSIVSRVRAENRLVVFTNGCFDIIHPGHIHLLNAAAENGDVLIVGLNSDESVQKIKGGSRPILTQRDRALVIEGLSAVDYVVIFDEETPEQLIKHIRPDVLVKGSDWRDAGVVGGEFVKSYGGQVILVPLLKGYSTSSIVEKLEKDEKG